MRTFLDHPGPIAFAHRGGAEEAPENTLPAFAAAVALGYRYLETDVHVTRDGIVVAFHDDRLDRVTDRRGAIAALPLRSVREADAGHSFTPDAGASFPFRGRGVHVPSLEELLAQFPQARFNIDPKTDACVLPLLQLLRRHDAFERVCIGSFSDRRVSRVRALSGGAVCTSMGRRAVAVAVALQRAGRLRAAGADCVQVPLHWRRVAVVSPRLLAAAHRAGLPVHVWTVNDADTMNHLLDLGVDGIMTDRPRLLRQVLESRGAWTP